MFERGEWGLMPGEPALNILVVRDSKTKGVFAHAVPAKGVDEQQCVIDFEIEDIT